MNSTETNLLQCDVVARGPLFCLEFYVDRRDEVWQEASRVGQWQGASTTTKAVPWNVWDAMLRAHERHAQAYRLAQRAAFL